MRQGVRNTLYVHASPSFASLWLMPRIGHFAQAHPGVSLFFSASHLHSDFELAVGVAQWADWFALHAPLKKAERFALRFDRAMMAMEAAVQDLGGALESTTIGGAHIEAGRLQPVFDPAWSIPVQAHFVVYPERHGQRSEVKQFLEWLSTQTSALSDLR